MLNAAPLLQTVMVLSDPAFGAVTCVTVTLAVALAQGGTPSTVYTYAPGVETPGV